ncbi:MAG TPA: CRISPR-associated endonuclease Cas2 [Thermoanaerobaculia bacterium]|nr:CRISPR-associated endonuclease Cas2 [Thermoanaerobaculia bacterium]HUM30075.1 CRISPR-associated endonuclease Cas2 [Thermoanaerobaculia bacterium]HXK69429.1 CRISPR-associated endonuclease Cas2 [Thermoanaerobaculia bacterium]
MLVVVVYDINSTSETGAKRLRNVAKACKDFGQRVQNSVFECLVDPGQWTILRDKLIRIIDMENDSLRFYFLGKNWRRRLEHIGSKASYDPEGPLVV